MTRLFSVALAAITLSSSAFAAPVASSATLTEAARSARPVTEAGAWRCDGTTCTGMATSVPHETIAACTGIADKAGRVAAFTVGDRWLGAEELARCNRHLASQ